MNYIELFLSAFSSLRSNILRTSLTMLGIIIGIASVIIILTLAAGATASITSSISSLGSNLIFIIPGGQQRGPVQGANIVTTLTLEDMQAIARVPHVAAISGIVNRQLQVVADGQNTSVSILGVTADYQTVQSTTTTEGMFISTADVDGMTRVAVLGPQVVTDLFGEGFDPVGRVVNIASKPFFVIGVTQAKGGGSFSNPDDTVYVPLTTAMRILFGQNFLSSIQLTTDNPQNVDSTIASIKNLLLQRHRITDSNLADFRILSSKDTLNILNTVTGLLTSVLAGIAAISLLVGGIGIMNIMLVTVTERTHEIGLLKAIGAKRRDILTQFLIESIVLTLSGGIVGMVIGILFSFFLAKFILQIPFIFQITSIILAVGVSTLVGVVFGIYPAQRAARLSPIDALRYE